ncbi:helix-turn-helix domain-containing protein, partial [Lactobacillus helveticus]
MSFALNGNRLREARQYRQLTITKLAEKVNVSKQMISKYERENA